MDLYVYYKVDPAAAADLAGRVAAMQARLTASFRVAAALRRRPGEQDGRQTWMEVYPGVGADFPARLDTVADGAEIAGLIAGPRRAEIFTDLTPCA